MLDELRKERPHVGNADWQPFFLPQVRDRILRNARVIALTDRGTNVRRALASRGLGVVHIEARHKSFIIGSSPVVKLTLPGRSDIRDPTVEMWLPIASDVMVGLGREAGTETLASTTDASQIRHINEAIASQSTMIAGASKALVRSLAKR